VLTYRNDPEAPASPDGHYHLGDTEWLDVEAALHHALANGAAAGARGWSMGAAITGALLDRSPLAPRVAAVRDAPLLDWRATLRQQARIRRIPPALTGLTAGFTRRRIGIDFDRFDLRRRPPAVRPPTLMIHRWRYRGARPARPRAGRRRARVGMADDLPRGAGGRGTPRRGTPTPPPTRTPSPTSCAACCPEGPWHDGV
jgi:hypothetical protein